MSKKILIYVDAENCSVAKFDQFVEESSKDFDCHEYVVIGKFYGNHSVLGEIAIRCMQEGYEYVDTFMMNTSNKNVTDMKIVVDCITDVTTVYKNEVEIVYVVSSDHDFMPLAYKLKSLKCKVVMPFLSESLTYKTCTDLSKFLTDNGYDRIVRDRIMDKPYDIIKDLAGNDFNDEIIESFINKKKKKIAYYLADLLGLDVANDVLKIDAMEVSYEAIRKIVDLGKIKNIALFQIYTSKMYGLLLPMRTTESLLGGECDWQEQQVSIV